MNLQKSLFKIYRNNGTKAKLDSFTVKTSNCGPMVLDGLIYIKNDMDNSCLLYTSDAADE